MSSLSVNSSISSCSKPVDSCIQLDNSSAICFGLSLPYRSTSFILSNDSNDYNSTQEKLLLWSGNYLIFFWNLCFMTLNMIF